MKDVDIITSLHPPILESILCLVPLPLQEAARTSILSKEWRYIWTRIPKLVFNEYTLPVLEDENENWNDYEIVSQRKSLKLINVVKQVMSLRRGCILDFTLQVYVNENDTSVEVDRILTDLARNNSLNRLTVDLTHGFRFPLADFSLRHFTDMSLRNCDIHYQPGFNGFATLTRLYLHDVEILTSTLLHLLSNCPLLKDFTLLLCQDNIPSKEYASIIQLFKCIPSIEHFTTWGWLLPCLANGPVPRVLPTALVRLKSLSLDSLCFIDEYGLPFLIMLIGSAPNLEKLKIEVIPEGLDEYWKDDLDYVTKKKYSNVWLEFLNDFEIEGFSNSKPELDFVKLILVRSPVLKKARIILDHYATNEEEIPTLTTTLLRTARASLEVEISVERPRNGR